MKTHEKKAQMRYASRQKALSLNATKLKTVLLFVVIAAAQVSSAFYPSKAHADGQRTYLDVVFRICPVKATEGCTHKIEIAAKTYLFEGANAEASQALKEIVRTTQARHVARSGPTSVKAYFIFKSGMWPKPSVSQDVVEILSIHRTLTNR